MQRNSLLAAALAAGSLMGIASVAHAVPAVVAGTTYGPSVYQQPAPVYDQAPAPVYTYPSPNVSSYPGQTTVYSQPTVIVQSAPPAPIYERVPATREGYIWAPGHYVWDGGRYVWRSGEWMAARAGYAWQAAHWEQRGDGSWALVGGSWVSTDAYASNRNRGYGDRDGDGVINRDDRFPRDPSRW
jgi:hypothetical protein